jgi:hypothetical protein
MRKDKGLFAVVVVFPYPSFSTEVVSKVGAATLLRSISVTA